MTRKDFELIAGVLRNDHDAALLQPSSDFQRGWLAANEDLAYDLAEVLANTNERFDAARFLRAAGVRT